MWIVGAFLTVILAGFAWNALYGVGKSSEICLKAGKSLLEHGGIREDRDIEAEMKTLKKMIADGYSDYMSREGLPVSKDEIDAYGDRLRHDEADYAGLRKAYQSALHVLEIRELWVMGGKSKSKAISNYMNDGNRIHEKCVQGDTAMARKLYLMKFREFLKTPLEKVMEDFGKD